MSGETQTQSTAYLAAVMDRSSLVEVAQAHMVLTKRRGGQYSGDCPFHDDGVGGSLTVSEERQIFHCHGCKAHGTAVHFLMQFHKIPFAEAVNALGEFLGISGAFVDAVVSLPNLPPHEQNLVAINTRAAHFYNRALHDSAHAWQYLQKRGLSSEIIQSMEIGYAHPNWQSLDAEFRDYKNPALQDAGLTVPRDSGGQYDRFRDRIMFPIRSEDGHVIAFGGRIIDRGEPKYLNSPETPIFRKGNELYGLFEGKDAIRERGYALVTEGYMDVVSLHQHSYMNAVATLGTATSENHIIKLLKYTGNILYGFDGDSAGRNAAWRALESALPFARDGIRFAFLFFPDGHDPDSFIRANGPDAFEALRTRALTIHAFVMTKLQNTHDVSTLEGKAGLLDAACELICRMPAGRSRSSLVRVTASAVNLDASDVECLSGIESIAPPQPLDSDAVLRTADDAPNC